MGGDSAPIVNSHYEHTQHRRLRRDNLQSHFGLIQAGISQVTASCDDWELEEEEGNQLSAGSWRY